MHELRVLIEIRPRVVGLLDRHGDVRPALDRQAPSLLPAATTAAAGCLRQRLAGDSAKSALALDAAPRAVKRASPEFLGFLFALVFGRFLGPPQQGGAGGRCNRTGCADRRRNEDFFAFQRRKQRTTRSVLSGIVVDAFVPVRVIVSHVRTTPFLLPFPAVFATLRACETSNFASVGRVFGSCSADA